MSRRRRNLTIGLVLLLLLGGEIGYQMSRGRMASVIVNNLCPEPMEDLRLVCGSSSAVVGRLLAGDSRKVYLSGRGNQTLVVSYRQKGNSLQGFQVAGFDLAAMSRDGSRLVITVRPNEFERYQEEDDPSWPSRMATSSLRWLEEAMALP